MSSFKAFVTCAKDTVDSAEGTGVKVGTSEGAGVKLGTSEGAGVTLTEGTIVGAVSGSKLLSISAFPCKQPQFKKDQVIINTASRITLDSENSLIVAYDVYNADEIGNYVEHAINVERISGKSAFNSMKPRREICYTIDGQPYKYSGIKHNTAIYPQHVLDILPKIKSLIDLYIPDNKYNKLSNAVDIIYDSAYTGGGSIGAHGDNEAPWGLVAIFSLGQTRWLRLRRISDKIWYNVEMKHNSVLLMYGATFQQLYTHQVDKLKDSEKIMPRMSLNVRYLEGVDNIEQVSTISSN